MSTITIPTQNLNDFCVQLCTKAGSRLDLSLIISKGKADPEEANLIASNLVLANLKGHDSHGVGCLPRYLASVIKKEVDCNVEPDVEDCGLIIRIDAKVGFGQSMGKKAMEIGIRKAKEQGICLVALRNSHHLGRIGHWAEMCVAEGLSSVHFTNVAAHEPIVAPHLGADGRLITNPVTVGCMDISDNNAESAGSNGVSHKSKITKPVIMDFATSELALGKVRECMARGEKVKEGVLLDKDGYPTTDPTVMWPAETGGQKIPTGFQPGSLLPCGGHKGYGLGFICEIFGGLLTGGQTVHPKHPRYETKVLNSMMTFIFDPCKISGKSAEDLKTELKELEAFMKESPLRKDSKERGDRILIPGEAEQLTWEKRSVEGIPVSKGALDSLMGVGRDLGLSDAEMNAVLGI